MSVATFALRNAKVVAFVVLVLAVLGVRSYVTLPASIFPTMTFSKIDLVANAGDLPPERIRIAVMKPLEAAIQALPAVTKIEGTASQGSAELLITFAPSTDPVVDQQFVDRALQQVRASTPDITSAVAEIVNPDSEPVLSYAMTSPTISTAVLGQMATLRIQPALFGATGLGRVLVTGAQTIEIHVALDAATLATHGITAGDVSRALAATNAVQAVGAVNHGAQRYTVLLDSSLASAASIGSVVVQGKNGVALPISALGTVTPGVSPRSDIASIAGTHGVILNAYPLPGADAVQMAHDVEARLATVRPSLPRDVKVTKFWDQTTLIVDSQTSLRDAILLGALIAIGVIFLFLRSLALTAIAAAVIPIAMAIAIFALQLAHQTLNLMSVGGLAVAVGLIIDDAIVVVEGIERVRHEQPDRPIADVVREAMAQLVRPMVASTSATVVVFLPLALLTGVTGFFFRALAFTLAASLVVSLALALLVAPPLARALFGRVTAEREHRPGVIDRVLGSYEPVVRWALGHRVVVYAASAATLVVTFLLLRGLPSNFLPTLDEGAFEIAYTMPTGLALGPTDRASTAMERIVASDPAVAAVGRVTGVDSNGFSPTPLNHGLLRVTLVPPAKRDGYLIVSDRLRTRLSDAIPAATYDFRQILEDLINGLSGTPAPIEVVVSGPDQATLIAGATAIATAIGTVPGVVDAVSGVVYDSPSLRVAPRGATLASLGVTPSDIADALAASTQGTVATNVGSASQLVPVRVALANPRAFGALGDSALAVNGTSPGLATGVSLDALANVKTTRLSSEEYDLNGQRIIRVTANLGAANLSAVVASIRAKLSTTKLPSGVTYEIGGQIATQQASFSEFLNVIAIAIALVFAVMLATFRSYRLPLVILTAVPLALIGVALGLTLTGTAFNVSSFMGLLMLVGIVVKNGILLIDVANEHRAAGDGLREALVAAGKTRLRPIVMTTLAAIGGLLPLAFGLGQGSEMEKPLAIAVIGGLSTATIFTLIVIPVLYAAFAGGSPAKSQEGT